MQTGENSVIEARILYYSNSYIVKYKFMTFCLNTTINSSAVSGLLYLINHLSNL